METRIIYIDTADMAKETGLSIQACQLLALLQSPHIENANDEAVKELLDNGLVVESENSITLSPTGLNLIQDFQ